LFVSENKEAVRNYWTASFYLRGIEAIPF